VSLLVTGASGYLGAELLRRTRAVGVSSADVDIRDESAVAALFERLRPEAVLAGHPVRAATSSDSDVVRPRDCSLAIDRARALLRTRLRGAREVLGAQHP